MEEIAGMNKSTGGYQLALAEARKAGHPIVAMVIGRAISGAFLCHGLQADHILALSKDFGTMIHVMPLTSIARITKWISNGWKSFLPAILFLQPV